MSGTGRPDQQRGLDPPTVAASNRLSQDGSGNISLHDASTERKKALGKELAEAAAEGNLAEIQRLVDNNASVNAADYDKRSAMHLACSEGHVEVVEFLITKGAAISIEDRWGNYPIVDAHREKHWKVVDLLMKHGGHFKKEDLQKFGSELCVKASKGDLEAVKDLVCIGTDVNSKDFDRRTPLHVAAAEGHVDVVEYLIAHKADPTSKDRWGGDPLKDAIRGNHKKVQDILKQAGSLGDQDEHSDHRVSTGEKLCAAACNGDLVSVKQLIVKNASVNACDYDKRSALHLAAAEGHADVVAFLVSKNASVNAKDRWGGDPLKDAIRGGHHKCQEILRAAGGRGDYDDHSDHRDQGDKMCNAASKGDFDLIKRLVKSNAAVNAADYDGRSALHLSAAEGHDQIVKFLIDNKADVHVKDRWGGDPLKDAIRSGHRKVQKVLLDAGAGRNGTLDAAQEEVEMEKYKDKSLVSKARVEQWFVDRREVTLGAILGEGQQGYVKMGDWRGMPVVCKVLKNQGHAADELDFQNEISVLSHLRHPNLVLFLGACIEGEPKIIISEFLSGGSLEDVYAQKEKEKGKPWRPNVHMIHLWAIELARALNFLHKCVPPILHRDLKPGNLLLTAENHLKVSDFGLSKIVEKTGGEKGAYVMTGVTGTLRYMAPEVMRCELYNEKVDVYSFAMVCWFMCTGVRPLLGATQKTFLDAAKQHDHLRPDIKVITYQPLAALMEEAWAGDPAKRPSADAIVARLSAMELPANPKHKAGKSDKNCSVQ